MDTLYCLAGLAVPLLLLFGLLWYSSRGADAATRRLRAAQDAYHHALQELRAHPTSLDLQQRVIDCGHAYANEARNHKGVAVFSDATLSHDIEAATAIPVGAVGVEPERRPLMSKRVGGDAE